MMDPRADLEQTLQQDRAALEAALRRLQQACRKSLSLRGRIQDRPRAWIVGAVAAGLLLALRPHLTRRLLGQPPKL